MKIAILTIATNEYKKLFFNFKQQIIEKFLPLENKEIFTDDLNINHTEIINIPHLPWPLCTLLRFYHINKHKEKLFNFDLIYYIDVDMMPYSLIDEDVIPTENEIVCVQHYWQFNSFDSYENKNEKSTAFINFTNNIKPQYCQGCFFGARVNNFLNMSKKLEENINKDLKNNIIAKWHDESHLNNYIISHPKKILNNGYAHPQSIPFSENKNQIKFIHKNSNTFGLN